MKRDAAKRVVVVMATQPLYVVAVRSMAQFVGGERKYNGLLSPFKDILKENGIIGEWELTTTEFFHSAVVLNTKFI